MTIFQALILGLVQGLTEFLPISSSGHLALFQSLFQINESFLTFDILIHVATLGAVIIFFRSQILQINRQYILWLIIGSIPAFILGFSLYSTMEAIFSSLIFTSVGFFITGLVLLSTKKINYTQNQKPLTNKSALIIGIAQAIAILPSISRSGFTVAAGLHLKINKDSVFAYSFLLSIPAILGALALELFKLEGKLTLSTADIVGMLTAFVTGFASLYLLRYLTNRSQLYYFGYYCLLLALLTIPFGIYLN